MLDGMAEYVDNLWDEQDEANEHCAANGAIAYHGFGGTSCLDWPLSKVVRLCVNVGCASTLLNRLGL